MVHNTNPEILFEGTRDNVSRMWIINLSTISEQPKVTNNAMTAAIKETNVYDCTLKRDIVKYLHCVAESPAPATWCDAIDNKHYATWNELTSQMVRKHLPKSLATTKGYMKQIQHNLRSTKQNINNNHDTPPAPSEIPTKSNMNNVRQNTVTIRCMIVSSNFFSTKQADFQTSPAEETNTS